MELIVWLLIIAGVLIIAVGVFVAYRRSQRSGEALASGPVGRDDV